MSTVVPEDVVVGSGDINNDATVSIGDLQTVIAMHLGEYRGTQDQFLRADVNFNGHVDRGDVLAVQDAFLGKVGAELPKYQFKPGDVDGNGAITLGDLILLIQYQLNQGSSAPFLIYNADVNQDYFIDVTDINKAIELLLNQ